MKKQILLLCAAVVFNIIGASAQTLALQASYMAVTGPANANLDAYVTVTNTGTTDLFMMIKRSIITKIPAHIELFCSGSLCFAAGDSISSVPDTVIAGGTTSLHATVIPMNSPGTTSLRYLMYSEDDPTDSAGVTIDFAFTTVGLNSIKNTTSIGHPSPNPADGFTLLTYNLLNSSASDRMVVYNMLGGLEKSMEIPGTTGVLVMNTNDLPSGVYFVSYQQNGKTSNTTKLVVSHR